jgi:hypothetical protein
VEAGVIRARRSSLGREVGRDGSAPFWVHQLRQRWPHDGEIIVGPDRHKPASAVATPAEAKALLTSMLAYAGTYTIDSSAKTLTHHIDVSWDQTRTGESHVRTFELNGDRLILTTQPSRDPASGKATMRTLLWERVQ